ncbi:MAG: TetR family transcriptional regulator [Hamadaea sp.]|nr:TetR family transcriptional regulator [Hamadaea sp.]
MTPTRERALAAAVDLVGTQGLRALTHARVDEHAGLPKGSTSNSFRTRAALLSGVVDWMAARDYADVTLPEPGTPDDLVDMLCGMFAYTADVNRTLTTARLVFFLEAAHNADVRAAIERGHAPMRAWTVGVLTRLGADDPQAAATALISCVEGLTLHRIARGDDRDPRPAIALVVRGAFGA